MLIQNFGLFWDRDEVSWRRQPGQPRQMLGRYGSNRPVLRVADMWQQRGLYVLYSHTGPYYVGIARKQALGKRLADHLTDKHADAWVRFSWFGFLEVSDDTGSINTPDQTSEKSGLVDHDDTIADMEALLIKSMGTYNVRNENFREAWEWRQVELDDSAYWTSRLWV